MCFIAPHFCVVCFLDIFSIKNIGHLRTGTQHNAVEISAVIQKQ